MRGAVPGGPMRAIGRARIFMREADMLNDREPRRRRRGRKRLGGRKGGPASSHSHDAFDSQGTDPAVKEQRRCSWPCRSTYEGVVSVVN